MIGSSSTVRVAIARPAIRPPSAERAGVAHEDPGRGRVPPQEAEAAPPAAAAAIMRDLQRVAHLRSSSRDAGA